MKKLIYILFASVLMLTGCSEDFDINDNVQDINAEFIPGSYVAFNAPGANVTLDPEDVKEGETVELNVEVPTGSVSDVTVNFTFGGTAVYGTDFTVPGGSSAGGSVVIEHDPDAPDPADLIDNTDIVVTLLTDDNQDGNKTLVVTLASASNANGEFLVGRGGSDILKSQTVNIADVDCGDVAGLYNVTGTIIVDDFGSGPYAYDDRIALADCSVEGEYNISDITGGLYTNDYATAYNVTPAGAVIEFDPTVDGPVTWSGVSDQFGGNVIEDPASATASNYNAGTGVITIYWTATAYGERGITTYTVAP